MKMKRIWVALLSAGMVFGMGSCMKEDLDDIRQELQEHDDRLASLEEWQESVNTDISSLQSLVEALENNDYVTGVTPLADGSGYEITFSKSGKIIVKHGEKGDTGDTGATPAISVKQDTDGTYYWTVNGEWLLDGDRKIPVTGPKGEDGDAGASAIAPQVRINAGTNEWEISTDGGATWTSTGVQATGNKGEQGIQGPVGPSGAACGITDVRIDGNNVIFTIGTGQDAQKITIPLSMPVLIFNDLDKITVGNNVFSTESALFSQAGVVIQTRVESKSADGTDIITRSASDRWDVNTSLTGNKLEITVNPAKETVFNETAILKVAVTSEDGQLLASGQKVFTNGIFTGILSVSSVDDMMAQLNQIDKTVATDIKIRGNFDADVTISEMAALMSVIKSFNQIGTLELSVPQITLLNGYAFEDVTNLKVFKADYLRNFQYEGTFWGSGVEEVYLPQIEALSFYEFQNCTNLRTVYLPNVTEITGSQTFFSCTALEALDLPNLETFGELNYANFAKGCRSLKEVNMPKVTTLPSSAFSGCTSLTDINVPEVRELGQRAFEECTSLKTVSLPNVKVLGQNLFRGCTSLGVGADIEFENVEELEHSAFWGCSGMTKVILEKVTKIGASVFEGCRGLKELSLGPVSTGDSTAFTDVDTESCTLTFYGTPTYGNLDKENNMWCGKKWKAIYVN